MVQRTYGVMTNDTLLSVPLFVFMGYIMERAALVDRMFHSVQLAFRRVPGLAGGDDAPRVRVLGHRLRHRGRRRGPHGRHRDAADAEGGLRRPARLGGDHRGRHARHPDPALGDADRLRGGGRASRSSSSTRRRCCRASSSRSSTSSTSWAGRSSTRRSRPSCRPTSTASRCPSTSSALERGRSRSVVPGLLAALVRPALARGASRRATGDRQERARAVGAGPADGRHLRAPPGGTSSSTTRPSRRGGQRRRPPRPRSPPRRRPAPRRQRPPPARGARASETPQELGAAETEVRERQRAGAERRRGPPEEMASAAATRRPRPASKVPAHFYQWFWGLAAFSALLLLVYFWRMDGEQLEILKELIASVVPLGVLTAVVLAVILFGICTATESAAIGALGALYLAVMAKYAREVWWWSLVGRDRRLRARAGTRARRSRRCWWRRRSAGPSWARSCPGLRHLRESQGAPGEPQAVDVPHREDHRHGVLALRRLGAVLRRVRAARRPGADRALGAQHEPLAARLPDHRAAHHLPARLAARVDRDHRHLLPDLHSAADPLPRRPASCSAPWWR